MPSHGNNLPIDKAVLLNGGAIKTQAGTIIVSVDSSGNITMNSTTNTIANLSTSGTTTLGDASSDTVTNVGTLASGQNSTDRVTVKGVYMSPANVAVTVPAITDPDIAKVDVNVASAFSMQPAVGDAVIAIPQEAMEANARILNCYVTATDHITVVFGSEGGNVTGGSKNFKFLVIDLT